MVRDERGQAAVLLVGLVAVAAAVLLALVPVAHAVADRARAESAADAAALAGAADGEDAAREVAEANGARLVRWLAEGPDVWVEVAVGRVHARAKGHRGEPVRG
jgi:secretion/DNA translocation related TadE-like protein